MRDAVFALFLARRKAPGLRDTDQDPCFFEGDDFFGMRIRDYLLWSFGKCNGHYIPSAKLNIIN